MKHIPISIQRAVWLLLSSTALTLVVSVSMWFRIVDGGPQESEESMAGVIVLVTIVTLCFLTYKISTRRNWARSVLAAIVGLGSLGMVLSFIAAPGTWSVANVLDWSALVQTLLQLTAVALVFSSEANQWFRS